MSFLGLDIGTGGCKAVVFNHAGQELASAYREYPLLHQKVGWAELDSLLVVQKCFDVLKEVNSQLISDPVQAMSISSQGEAFTPVDKNGNILSNAMVSSDMRSKIIANNFSNEFGVERLYQITGHTAHPLFSLFKLIWLKENQPEIWNKASGFYCFEDLLHHSLGVVPSISYSLAGRTMLFDVNKKCWSTEILDAIQLDCKKLAQPAVSGTITGVLESGISKKLGFVNQVKLVAGGHDQNCAALGAGVTEPGICMYATGTVECFCPVLEKPSFSESLMKNNLCCYNYTIDNRFTTVAYNLTGGNILRWFRDEFGYREKQLGTQMNENPYKLLLDSMPPTPTDLLVLPYFTASGTPFFDSDTKGSILGLRLSTKKSEILKSLLEGVAFEMRLNLEIMETSGMPVHSFIATGGGARNADWLQLKTDILNKPLQMNQVKESGCFGAAMLACSAYSGENIINLIKYNTEEKTTFFPNQEISRIYDGKYLEYKDTYMMLKKLYKPDSKNVKE